MKCYVDGCERDAMYKIKKLCQKHYFRIMRNGTSDIKITQRKYRRINSAGYHLIHEKNHPLVNKDEYVYEHRYVIYNAKNGIAGNCELCGVKEDWATCHVDHIDNDKSNNKVENLRVCCRACNVMRGHSSKHNSFNSRYMLTVGDATMSADKWASMDGVLVCAATIKRRKDMGLSDFDAIFMKRKTHHRTNTIKKIYRNWSK